MIESVTFSALGDNGVLIKFEDIISEEINKKVACFSADLINYEITEVVSAYNSILVYYNPKDVGYFEFVNILKGLLTNFSIKNSEKIEIVHIPVCYSEKFGIDISDVANLNNLTIEEVIKIHSEGKYLIYMIGFNPGFPYLGGMSDKIATPRLLEPRTKISAGSVGIAGSQTGIYPLDSPGGWRIIGRTPVRLFDLRLEKPFLLKQSQYLKFEPILEDEYDDIVNKVEKNEYKVKISEVGSNI